MAMYLVPQAMQKNINGHAGFQDRTRSLQGVPGYSHRRGYGAFDVPTPIGARYFPPEKDWDEETDQPTPLAVGYKANGGRPAYRQRVFNAAKKNRKKYGFSRDDIDQLGPEGYGPDWSARKVA